MISDFLMADAIIKFLMDRGVSNNGIRFYIDLLHIIKKSGPNVQMRASTLMKQMNISSTVLKNRMNELFEKEVLKMGEDGILFLFNKVQK